uniref:ankyrin repeat and BTB/POZ domain-containing protein 1-like n=1 Tax=Styela clava TaxID=7725 RepID=UPI00193AAEB7|nr:ankyrin repeat and BTB/POZ domain-containing protein 1-like [Styela clava]
MSAQRSLFLHCKEGNLSELKHIVEVKDIDLNVRDGWDSTPLYYACLCGHREIVEYLLQNGSKCEASTFDGERCLYGALTNDIRNLLRNWKQIHSTGKKRDRHYELLRHMLEEEKLCKDILFNVHGVEINAHRCVIAARSHFFSEALSTHWKNRSTVALKHEKVTSDAFHAILQFLYLGRVDIKREIVDDVKRLAHYCNLQHLSEEILSADTRMSELFRLKPNMSCRVKIVTVESETSFARLATDLRYLAESTLPSRLRSWIEVLPFPEYDKRPSFYPDVCVEVEGEIFNCHKVFLCGRSDYFKALLTDHFQENKSSTSASCPIIKLCHLTPEIFKNIIIYIYSEICDFHSLNDAMDVLPVADMMLLTGLKRKCGNVLSQHMTENNIVDMYRCSQMFNLLNLEDYCVEFMAIELESLVESEEFIELVVEEANLVQCREETDSIPLIDEIRHHITDATSTYGQMQQSCAKLMKLDAMLARLGLEC